MDDSIYTNIRIDKQLATEIANNPIKTHLKFQECEIDVKGAQELAKSKFLYQLYFDLVILDEAVLTALIANTSVEKLYLSRINIPVECGRVLSQWASLHTIGTADVNGVENLVRFTHVPLLDLNQPTLDECAEALGINSHITDLGIMCATFTNSFTNAIERNAFIKKLCIFITKSPDGAISMLACNTNITHLRLHRTQTTTDEAAAFATNTTLKSLRIQKCDIRKGGAKALARNTTITALDLEGSKIRNEGVVELSRNTTITSLCVEDCMLTLKGATTLANNTTLTWLDISCNKIRDAGAEALALSTSITWLNASFTGMGNKGLVALSKNTTLETLDARSNITYMPSATALAANTTLKNLAFTLSSPPTDAMSAWPLFLTNTSLLVLNLETYPRVNIPYEVKQRLNANKATLATRANLISTIFATLAILYRIKRNKAGLLALAR